MTTRHAPPRALLCIATAALVLAACAMSRGDPTTPGRAMPRPPEAQRDALRWTFADGRPTAQALSLLGVLATAASAGLEPSDYRVVGLSPRLAPGERSGFDLALDAAALAYARDVEVGRVDPRDVGVDLERRTPRDDDATLLAQLATAPCPDAVLRALEPALPIYARLRDALAHERALAAGEWLPLPPGPRVLEPGAADASVAALAARLVTLGDLARDTPTGPTYDDALRAAVEAFQARHGLAVDGRVGPATRAALDVSPEARMQQIGLSLERLRWMSVDRARPPIVINVPEFRLRAIGDDGRVAVEMDVVVGRAFDRETPLFSGELSRVDFQPEWIVPVSIARGELLPREAREPGWLARHGYDVRGSATLVQRPGVENALGRVKFLLPNVHAVYLHDTPSRSLFARARRDFSHGCIRVADPAALAAFVLRRDPAWTPERIATAMSGEATESTAVAPAIPVHIVYLTAVVREDGELRYFEDVYGHDARLAAALVAARRNASP